MGGKAGIEEENGGREREGRIEKETRFGGKNGDGKEKRG